MAPTGPRDQSPRGAQDRPRYTDRRDNRDARDSRPRRDNSPNRDRDPHRNRRDDRHRSRSPQRNNPRDTRQRSPRRTQPPPRNPQSHTSSRPKVIKEEAPVHQTEDEDEETYMKRVMGFNGFRTTKNTKVPGNDKLYGVRKDKQTEYRQYMNRVGGFNRPLSPSRM